MKTSILLTFLLFLAAENLEAQFSDEFNQDVLDNGWSWVRESPSNWELSGGSLTIFTERGALNGERFNNVRNLLLQPLPGNADFTMDTELNFFPYWTQRNAGLLYFIDEDNYIRVSRGINDGHDDIWLEWETDGQTHFVYADAGSIAGALGNDFRLRLKKEYGNRYSASYQLGSLSAGWTSWNSFATETISFPQGSVSVGLQAANGEGLAITELPEKAKFNYFNFETKPSSVLPLHAAGVAFSIEAAHPSPSAAGSVLTIIVSTDRAAALQWRMTDILGREVIEPQMLGYRESGSHSITVSTGSLPPGVYLWQINAGTSSAMKRILLTR
ncbi:MAG: T9SS type A sorting domain-containing protein [Bacteroidota bacterium]